MTREPGCSAGIYTCGELEFSKEEGGKDEKHRGRVRIRGRKKRAAPEREREMKRAQAETEVAGMRGSERNDKR